jgi:hypothetical protein
MLTCFKAKDYNKRNEKCKCGSGKKNKLCCRSHPEFVFIDKRKEENKINDLVEENNEEV